MPLAKKKEKESDVILSNGATRGEVRNAINRITLSPLRCADHPRYKVMRKPTSGCEQCWRIRLAKKDQHC